jgi:hypothetical protein
MRPGPPRASKVAAMPEQRMGGLVPESTRPWDGHLSPGAVGFKFNPGSPVPGGALYGQRRGPTTLSVKLKAWWDHLSGDAPRNRSQLA